MPTSGLSNGAIKWIEEKERLQYQAVKVIQNKYDVW